MYKFPKSISIPLLLAAFFGVNMFTPMIPDFRSSNGFWPNVTVMLIALLLMISAGRQYYINAYKALINRKATMSTLIALSTSASFIFSTVILLYFRGQTTLGTHLYFDAIIFIIAFVNLGGYLEDKANERTYDSIKQLIALKPKTARRVTESHEEVVEVSALRINELFRVNAGDKVPLDAVVVEGQAYINDSMITGEPIPSRKNTDDQIFAGTIVEDGTLICRVLQADENTLLQQIINEVDKAQTTKPPIANLVNKITGIFVPFVLVSAIVTAIIWYLYGPEPKLSFTFITAMTVLVIACPCALGLAIPTSIRVAIGLAAKHGLLIRQGRLLQIAGQTQTLILDKTGTITEGKPSLVHIEPIGGSSPRELLSLAYSLELNSSHPLAKAIKEAAIKDNVESQSALQFKAIDGQGLTAIVSGEKVLLGNQRLMEEHQIDCKPYVSKINAEQEKGHSVLLIAKNRQLLGLLIIADKIRPEAKHAISALKKLGIHIKMLTGDNEKTAQHVASVVGIDDVIASCLPQDKLQTIKQLIQKKQIVAMVGDGINDAPALSLANIGIAIAKGSDIANESADVSLISMNLEKIVTLIILSRKTLTNIKQNLASAFLYNTLGIPVAAGALYPLTKMLLNPGIASACMAASSLCVVLNANRLALSSLTLKSEK